MFSSLFSTRNSEKNNKNPSLFAQMKKAVGNAAEVIVNVSGRVATVLGLTLSGTATMDAQTQAISQLKAPVPTQSCLDLPRNIQKSSGLFMPKKSPKQPDIAARISETPSAKAKAGNSVGHFVAKNFKSKEWEGRLVGTDGSMVVNDRKDLKAGKTYFYAPNSKEATTFATFLGEHPIEPKQASHTPKTIQKPVLVPTKKIEVINTEKIEQRKLQEEQRIQTQKALEAKQAALAIAKKQAAEKEETKRIEDQRKLEEAKKFQIEMKRIQAEKLVEAHRIAELERKKQALEQAEIIRKTEEIKAAQKEARRVLIEKESEAKRVAELERKKQLIEQAEARNKAEDAKKKLAIEKAETKRKAEAIKKAQEVATMKAQNKPKAPSAFEIKEAAILKKVETFGHNFDINRFVESIFFNESRHTYNINNAHKAKQLEVDPSKVAYGAGQFTYETLRSFGIITKEQLADFQSNPRLQRTIMRKFTLGNVTRMVEEPSIAALLREGVQPHEILAAMHHMGSEGVARVARRSLNLSNPSMAFHRNLKTSVDWLGTRTDLYVRIISQRYLSVSLGVEKPVISQKRTPEKPIQSTPITTLSSKSPEVTREEPTVIQLVPTKIVTPAFVPTVNTPVSELQNKLNNDPNESEKNTVTKIKVEINPSDFRESIPQSKVISFIPLNRQNQAAFERLTSTAGISKNVIEKVTSALQEYSIDELLTANMEHRTERALQGNIEDLQILAKLHEIRNAEKEVRTRFEIEDIFDGQDERSITDELEDNRSVAELLAA